MSEKLVIGVTGMPGAGKTFVVNVARDVGYRVVVMGDEVRAEAERRNMAPTPENIGRLMLELRQLEGETAIAKRCVRKICDEANFKVIIDGIRSLAEVEEFKSKFRRFVLLAVHASPETRFQRLYHRCRSDDPKSWREFHERDMRELSVGLGGAIAMSKYMFVNEGPKEEAEREFRLLLKRIEKNE